MKIANIFRRVPAEEVRREQLYEAERLLVEHHAAAEMHTGLAGIYRARVERLRRELASAEVSPLRAAK